VAPSTLEERFEAGESSDALAERGDIWSAALDIYAQHPVIGTGINNFSVAYARLPSTLSDASQRRLLDWEAGAATIPFHAHNAYLNLLAEQGIVGLAAFLVFALGALAVLYRGSRASDALTRAVCLGAGAGWMTWAVRNLVDVALYEEVTYPLLTLTAVASVLVALEERPVEVPRRAAIATAAG
jgi:O-antigen ligase